MARPKKYAESESIGVRFPADLLKRLSNYANTHQKTRSEVVVNAVSHYIHSKQCVLCGAVNPGEGKHCAVCGADLFPYDDVKAAAIDICESGDGGVVFDNNCLFDKIDDLLNAGFEKEYTLSIFTLSDSVADTVKEKICISIEITMRIPNTDLVVTGNNGGSISYHIDPKFLFAKLKGDNEEMNRLRKLKQRDEKNLHNLLDHYRK